MKPETSSDTGNSNHAANMSLMNDFRYPIINLNPEASIGTQEETCFVAKSNTECTTNVYPQDVASMFKAQFPTSDYTNELVFCSAAAAGNSIMAMQPAGSLEEMQALANASSYGTGAREIEFSAAATLAMAATSTPALVAGYPCAMPAGSLATGGSCNGSVLGGGTIGGTAGMQPMGSSHSQLLYQIYAPAPLSNTTPLMAFSNEHATAAAFAFPCSSTHASAPASVVAPVPVAATAAFCTPIMGPAQQQQQQQQHPGEQLFGKLDYAGVSSSAAGGFLPAATGLVGHGVPSLAHTPQPDRRLSQSSLALLSGYAISPQTVASASPMAAPAMASPMISSYFDGISLGNLSTPHLPTAATAHNAGAQLCQAMGAVRPRVYRSVSNAGTHARARSSSPSHLTLSQGLRTTAAHPYFAHAHTVTGILGSGSSAAHSRAGSEARIGRSKRASVHMDGVPNHGRKLSIGSTSHLSLSRAAAANVQRAGSTVSSTGSSEETEDEVADKQVSATSGRIPLTSQQREVFFRWLYENAHDPKPKGHERDRLRHIGNMSRERFKTWFANARRRYFVTTQENGVLKYSVNQRFLVACQRAKISLD
ncbi:hypothetical protein LPJ64_003417 [Coemansia asiatica]|uniref:Homeobox domain-containing protein n=1 Tax=Coemansia asiatica TaxID=1052880 RepID=A0A9W7XK55_9FUNG|nr:hypothetical protein LPJ64_003417 [Coemansia asiatica]